MLFLVLPLTDHIYVNFHMTAVGQVPQIAIVGQTAIATTCTSARIARPGVCEYDHCSHLVFNYMLNVIFAVLFAVAFLCGVILAECFYTPLPPREYHFCTSFLAL